jgi:hypothetical protein
MRAPILATAAALTLAATAHAQLGLPLPPLPDPIDTVTQTTDQITGAVPDPTGGVVDTVTGTVGGVIDTTTGTVDGATGGVTGGLTDTVGQTVDQVLGGTLGELPLGTVDDLLGAAGLTGLNGANGAPGAPGTRILPDGTVLIDKAAPVTRFKVLTRNRTVGRTGKLKLQVSSNEPSVVALVGTVRPGRAWKLHGKARKHHSRKAIKIPKVVLAYRQPGSLRLTIQFSRRAQRNIRHSYNTSVKLTLVAIDVARNQVTRKLNRIARH